MRHAALMTAAGLFGMASRAEAQPCAPPPRPLSEFQVEQPALYTGDTTLVPRPARMRVGTPDTHALVVQFVVDTLGRPVEATFRALASPTREAADSVRAALPRWRFAPARHRGCRVPQVVQTAVVRAPS